MLLKFFINNFKAISNFKILAWLRQPYWVKIITKNPECIYYFGPFEHQTEAKKMHYGYIEDLEAEQARVVSVEIRRCSPTELTIIKNEHS